MGVAALTAKACMAYPYRTSEVVEHELVDAVTTGEGGLGGNEKAAVLLVLDDVSCRRLEPLFGAVGGKVYMGGGESLRDGDGREYGDFGVFSLASTAQFPG